MRDLLCVIYWSCDTPRHQHQHASVRQEDQLGQELEGQGGEEGGEDDTHRGGQVRPQGCPRNVSFFLLQYILRCLPLQYVTKYSTISLYLTELYVT